MDTTWFKEDRQLAKNDPEKSLEEHKAATKAALLNSSIMRDRLERILNEMIESSIVNDEDFSKPNWEREFVANASRRKTLREIKKLITFKEKTNVR